MKRYYVLLASSIYIYASLASIEVHAAEKDPQSNEKTRSKNTQLLTLDDAEKKYPKYLWSVFRTLALSKWGSKDVKNSRAEILKGGFSSDAVFKVKIASKDYVLRFIGKEKPIKDRQNFIEASRWAGDHDFAPKVLLNDSNHLLILMGFIQGRTLTLEDTQNEKIIKEVAVTLSKIHKAPQPSLDLKHMSQFTIGLDWYDKVRDSKRPFGPLVLKEAYKRWQILNEQVNLQATRKVVLHNDPNLRNIMLSDGKVIFVDWELAGVEDPRKELAHVCAWMGLNANLTEVFLSAYYGRKPSSEELVLMKNLRKMIHLEFAWVGLSTVRENEFDQKTWDQLYETTVPRTVEYLSITQMNSERKPSESDLINLYLGLLKQFMQN